MLRNSIFCFFLSLSSALVIAQPANREIVNQSIEWFAVSSNVKFHKSAALYLEGQFRYAQSFDPMQYQFRTGLDFTLNKHFTIMPIGYVYIWNPLYGKQPATYVNNEHRFYEQVAYKNSFKRIFMSHRLRIEQRMIQVHSNQNGEIVDEGYSLRMGRARYRFMANIPLNHAAMDPKTVFLNVYNEVFLSWGKTVTFHEPDQNRIFVGAGYQFTKLVNVTAGCLYQALIKANGAKQENNIGLQAQLTYNFDFTKPSN